MGRGDLTRQSILERASRMAAQVGLDAVTIGRLAGDLGLSKSGLFAHFQSKEALQVQILDFAAARFVDLVVRPALAAPRGEPRVRALFERWLDWERAVAGPGGCPFVAAASELDDKPGPARDHLVRTQRDWFETIATCFRSGVKEGHFRRDADPEQFAHDLYGVMLAYHHGAKLLRDPKIERRTRVAFENLITAARPPSRRGAGRG
jgi:AcrR family transcriptional regulator